MTIGSGIAFFSVPAVVAVIGHYFSGGDAILAIIIIGCVGYIQVARVIKTIELNKSISASGRNHNLADPTRNVF
jgi:hypothetical protein